MDNELLTIRQVSQELGIPIYTIRYFCNHGLVPGVKRSVGGHRNFNRAQCGWIGTLYALRRCGFTNKQLKVYRDLCHQGHETLSERKAMLTTQKRQLRQQAEDLDKGIDFIERREELFDEFMKDPSAITSDWL